MSSPFTPPADQLAAYFNPSQPRDSYQDFEIDQIAILLQRLGSVASSCPRTYIILRTIDKLSLLDALLRDGFGDQWFPVEPASLPSFLNPEVKSEIVDLQRIILTKSLDMENGRHSHFAKEEALPFEFLGRLGSGAYGQVDRIQSKISFRQYALKRIRRRIAFGNNSKEGMKQFLEEMAILKKLEHKHVVRYVGSYTDKSFLGLVMSPVAEGDLAAYLRQACSRIQAAQDNQFSASDEKTRNLSSSAESSTIQSYFGCLAASLSYLHYQCIRHKDIKPQNILIHNGSILITDFGLSNDFADDYGSTTSGPTPASPRYCAPEVAAYESRNMSSDIWSLGCVYFEMVAALHGFSADWIKEYFITHNSKGSHYNSNPEAIASLTKEWEASPSVATKEPLSWIRLMLRQDRQERPNAAQVLEMIISDGTDYNATRYCGMCCVPHDETGSDDSLLNDLDITGLNLATEIQEKNVFTSGHPSTATIPQVVPTANLPQLTAPQIQEILKPPRGYGASPYRRTEGRRGRKGTTKLPKRLVEKRAIIDLGYPFDEQDDFIVVTRALEKEQIDKIVKNSEKYQIENSPNLESQSSLTAQPSPRPSASLPQYNTHVGDHETS